MKKTIKHSDKSSNQKFHQTADLRTDVLKKRETILRSLADSLGFESNSELIAAIKKAQISTVKITKKRRVKTNKPIENHAEIRDLKKNQITEIEEKFTETKEKLYQKICKINLVDCFGIMMVLAVLAMVVGLVWRALMIYIITGLTLVGIFQK